MAVDPLDMTPAQIAKARDAGIISEAQAARLLGQSDGSDENRSQIGDEENLRFIRGFSDIFISLGLGLLILGLSVILKLLSLPASLPIAGFIGAGAMWLGAEYFGRKKRAHLPTLLIAIAFLLFVQSGAAQVLPGRMNAPGIMAALVTFAAMGLFYLRFRLPFCMALMAWSAVGIVFSLMGKDAASLFDRGFSFGLIGCGLVIFVVAILYDMRDTQRRTRFADNAFWLHLTAAPMIIHGIALSTLRMKTVSLFGLVNIPDLSDANAGLMLMVIAGLVLVGLALNRRALIASSLGYAAFAIAFLIKDTGLDIGRLVALTLLILGGGIVFLGVGWHGARRALLKVLPRAGFFSKIFPPEL